MTRELRIFGPYTTTNRDLLTSLGTLQDLAAVWNSTKNRLEFWDSTNLVWRGGGAGSALLDFGSFPGASNASVAVTGEAGILTSSIVLVNLSPVATADHTADEHLVESLRVFAGAIVAGTGFTIYGRNDGIGDTTIYGKWTVSWYWN